MVYNGRDLEECKQIGLDGELYLVEYLERELQGTGLKVHHAAGENVFAPFDIEIHDGSRVLVGIENKDITGSLRAYGRNGPPW